MKEQRVGILDATREQQQVGRAAAHRGFRLGARPEHFDPTPVDRDDPAQSEVRHLDTEAPSGKLVELAGGERRGQHLLDELLGTLPQQRLGDEAQRRGEAFGRRQPAQHA